MASTESYVTGSSDHRSSDEIRRDIERQRDELDVTTEVLQRKLAPRELAEQLWQDVRTRVGGGAGEVVDVVKRHPVPLGLIGAGIAWWLYESSTGRGLSFGNGDDHDEDDLGVGSMSTGSYGAKSSYSGSSAYPGTDFESDEESWRQRSRRAAQRSTERLRAGAGTARQGLNEAVDRNPLALGAACFSLGILAAIAVPSTNWEDRTLGDASDKVTRKAKDVAKDAAMRATEESARVAQKAADHLREETDTSSGSPNR